MSTGPIASLVNSSADASADSSIRAPASSPAPSRLSRAFIRYRKYRYLRRKSDYAAALDSAAPLLTYIGYLGHGNIGDEALYVAFRDQLFSSALLLPFDDLSLLSGIARLKTNRWVVLGGGTLINVNPYLEALERFAKENRPFAVFGTGVADLEYWSQHPQYERGNVERWINVLAKASYIGVRGPRSLRWLNEQGIRSVEMIGDPALSVCAAPRAPRVRKTGRPVLGINLGSHDPVSGGVEPTLQATAALIKYAVGKGFDVRFVALHYIDVRIAARLRDELDQDLLPAARFCGDVTQALAEIQDCDYLVGQRLHATVLACALGVPTLSLSYQPKCLDFLESIDRHDLAISTAQISGDQLIDRFDWLCDTQDRLLVQIEDACNGLRVLQRERASQLLSAIGSSGEMSVPDSA
jgi:polysaccharide pyruvyl transferase WcaK-like protein